MFHIDLKNLKNRWYNLTLNYTSDLVLIEELWVEIVKNYSAKSRHYHNLDHLEYMLRFAFEYKSEITDFNTLLFSIFYHDIIYNAKRSDNELKSAQLASDRLNRLGLKSDQINTCYEQILATKEHADGVEIDTQFLLDFDLAILGDEPEKYVEYTKKIRKEYAIYPDFMYNRGRRKVLRHFLGMDSIFKTNEFKINFEERARENLRIELGEK